MESVPKELGSTEGVSSKAERCEGGCEPTAHRSQKDADAQVSRGDCAVVPGEHQKDTVVEEGRGEGILSSLEGDRHSEGNSDPKSETDEATDDVPEARIIKYNQRSRTWSTSMEVPNEIRKYVVGAKGSKKRRLEEETECRIHVPSRGRPRPVGIVSSKSEDSVKLCVERLESMVAGARKRAPYTHFVSLPMNHPDIQASFVRFAETVQNDEELPESCREPVLFQNPRKLHLTVVMLSLLDEDSLKSAAETLEQVTVNQVRRCLGGAELQVEVKGLQCMNDNPAKVRVLYANASSEKLEEVVNVIADAMGDAELAPRRAAAVRIHMTLMNTTYARKRRRSPMDVQKLLEKYGDYDFGRITIPSVHVSCLLAAKDEDGFYSHIAKVSLLPEDSAPPSYL